MNIINLFRKQHIFFSSFSNSSLTKDQLNKLRKLNIDKISSTNTSGRINIFSKIVGKEKALWINSHFENDVLLKNQKEGLFKWAHQTEMEEKWRTEIKSKISKLDQMLSPEELDLFTEYLARLSLGIGITEDEARKITKLANKSNTSKTQMEKGGSREVYKKAHNELQKYIDQLKKSEQ